MNLNFKIPVKAKSVAQMYACACIVLVAPILLMNCAVFEKRAASESLPNDSYWIKYSSEVRGTVVVGRSDSLRFCAEPAPDVLTSLSSKLGASAKEYANISGEYGVLSSELAGRNSMVLALREALYRLCELSVNRPSIADSSILMQYGHVIDVINGVARSEAEASSDKAEAISKLIIGDRSEQRTENNKRYESAILFERIGFDYILENKFDSAQVAFQKVEDIYPQFHNAYEISKLLKVNADKKLSDDDVKRIKKTILNDYSWKMPVDIYKKMNEQVK